MDTDYLVTVKGFASVKMGFLASAPCIGAVAGNMIGGIISDRLLDGRRKPMLLLSGLMLGIGFAGYSPYPMGLASKSTYPTAFGIVNFLGQIGGATAPPCCAPSSSSV
ncbi:hypothetical protein [Duganella sp. sic0402]|uniref:hypothetical protein n=1 Tax=Duganella sp. sic0402 TaxID=2854786 RepID=UPI0035A3125E